MKHLKDTFSTSSGIKTLVAMCMDGKIFDQITTTQELDVHNYMVEILKGIGLNNANLEQILSFAMRLPEVKTVTEGEKVRDAYFGERPEI